MNPTISTNAPEAIEPPAWPSTDASADLAIDPLEAIRLLRSAGGGLFTQFALYGQLVNLEWALEKRRLTMLGVTALVGFACLLCVMFLLALLVLILSWDTPYRTQAAVGLIAFYSLGLGMVWHCLVVLSTRSSQAFAALREELSADFDLLKQTLLKSKL